MEYSGALNGSFWWISVQRASENLNLVALIKSAVFVGKIHVHNIVTCAGKLIHFVFEWGEYFVKM